jgi:hypothetical protein
MVENVLSKTIGLTYLDSMLENELMIKCLAVVFWYQSICGKN